jgi:hypothetical protein
VAEITNSRISPIDKENERYAGHAECEAMFHRPGGERVTHNLDFQKSLDMMPE